MESFQMTRRAVGFDDNDKYIDTSGVENDEDLEELEKPLNQTSESEKELSWDAAQIVPPPAAEESEAPKWVENGILCMKLAAYLVTFVVVLGSAAVSSGTFLFMTSQIKVDRTVGYCNRNYGSDKNLEVKTTEVSRISWMWVIFFSFCVPQVFVAGRSLRMVFFKTIPRPEFWPTFTVVFVFETLHVLGLSLMAFVVLPSLDSIKAAMLTSCVCIVPGILGLMSRNLFGKDDKKCVRGISLSLKIILDMAAIGGQATCIVAWPFVLEPELGTWKIWLIPASVILTSFGWWENYVDYRSPVPFIKWFGVIKNDLLECRYWTYAYISIWKMTLFFVAMIAYVKFINDESITVLFDGALFSESFGDYLINITEVSNFELGSLPGTSIDNIGQAVEPLVRRADPQVALQVFYIHVAAGWACYIFAKFVCKVTITEFSFAFPLNMATPVVVCTTILFCALRGDNPCYFRGSIPDYMFYTCPSGDFLEDFIFKEHGWVWLVWLLSQMWITVHTWAPMPERLLPTERIYCTPMYESLLLPLSMMLNKRRDDGKHLSIKKKKNKKGAKDMADAEDQQEEEVYEEKTVASPNMFVVGDGSETALIKQAPPGKYPKIITCATMWHETKDEMIACLKSIFRLDFDQSSRRLALNYLDIDDDYYDYETHIYFDDAFVPAEDRVNFVVNSFVKDLIEVMPEAATLVHGTETNLSPPKKYATPYGGRLVWTLPGKTKIICHLKDKNKIRHRKRWSQCMYMYYLLGYNIMHRSDLTVVEKDDIIANTYLLALDGDIDFQPRAVLLLVDLMKRNPRLGAACGRIHPIGTDGAGGLMVWYQQFEYAVGHWFQKATEHVIGCVLCSPGCFSLFRGAAILDDNVMKRYTTKSSQARHYVQFDQGEDRWLCTLMLQQGWKVEYSAASDSFTHCPEGFEEFYNQRRRWVPSTMANILDLLQDYKRTVQVNDNISMPYIAYQMFMMIGSILGPGTIFMMMTGAFNAAFKIEIMDAFLMNMVPLLVYMLVCYFMDAKYQLMLAQVLTALYAMVMMAVVVGTALQLQQEGVDSPSGIFFISMAMSFIVTGLLHPQELYCLPSGLVYYLTVPSMYLLLIIYSVFNLNNVSWGTREVAQVLTHEEEEEARKAAAEAQMKKVESKGLMKLFQKVTGTDLSSMFGGGGGNSYDGFISCMCCAGAKPKEQEATLLGISKSLQDLSKKLESIEKHLEPSHRGISVRRNSSQRRSSGSMSTAKALSEKAPLLNTVVEEEQEDEDDEVDALDDLGSISSDSKSEDIKPQERDDLTNPYWLEDPALRRCTVDFLNSQEIIFWKELIAKYLYPLDEEKPEVKKKIQEELLELRDKVIASFFMFNAIFILVVMLLQANKSSLHVDWPLNIKTNISFFAETTGRTAEVMISEEYLELEPVGMVFVFCFFIVLVTQFIAMLFHRLTTVMHLIATCNLGEVFKFGADDSKSGDPTIDGGEADLKKNAVKVVKQLQSLRTAADKKEAEERRYSKFGRRNTVANLAKAQRKKPTAPADLDVQFRKRLFSITEDDFESAGKPSSDILARRGTVKTLQGIMGSDASEGKARALGQALLKRRNTMYPAGVTGPRRPSSFARSMVPASRSDSIISGGILKRSQSARTTPAQSDSARSSLASMPSAYQMRPTFSSSTRSSTSVPGMDDIAEHDSSDL